MLMQLSEESQLQMMSSLATGKILFNILVLFFKKIYGNLILNKDPEAESAERGHKVNAGEGWT